MSHEEIRLGDSNGFVELRFLEHGPTGTPAEGDVRLGVSVRSDMFTGEYDQVWVTRDEWSSFLGSLRRLERERTGQASLLSMSPDEFALHLQIVDRAGHLAAHGYLSRYHFGHPSGRAARSCIEYNTAVDPSLLRESLQAFETLAQPAV